MDKKINIATDGANSAWIGFVLYQNANDLEEGKDVKIIKANSSGLNDSQKQYSDYITMVHHIEAGTEIDDIDKECELSNFHNFKDRLSVISLKGGQTLILILKYWYPVRNVKIPQSGVYLKPSVMLTLIYTYLCYTYSTLLCFDQLLP